MRQSKISRREFLEPWVGQQPGWRWARPQPSRRHRIRPRLRLREFLTRVLPPFTWKAGTSPGRNHCTNIRRVVLQYAADRTDCHVYRLMPMCSPNESRHPSRKAGVPAEY